MNCLVKEMEKVGRETIEKDSDIVQRSGPSRQYNAEVRMMETSVNKRNRGWIECADFNQYDGLTRVSSEASPKALAFVSRVVSHPVISKLFSQAGHTAANCRMLEYAKREPNGKWLAQQRAMVRRQS